MFFFFFFPKPNMRCKPIQKKQNNKNVCWAQHTLMILLLNLTDVLKTFSNNIHIVTHSNSLYMQYLADSYMYILLPPDATWLILGTVWL